ncbi:PorV/PorQ family protein [Elusimicrobiota bacterium]
MGSAYTAMANDSTALYWNPAGLAAMQDSEFSFAHSKWLAQSSFDFIGLAMPLEDAGELYGWQEGVLAMGVSRLSHPKQEGRNEMGEKTSDFQASDMSMHLAFSSEFTDQVNLGIGFKFIQSRIAQYKGHGFALDAGGIYHPLAAPVSFGLAVKNIGPGIRFIDEETPLPLSASFGMAYQFFEGVVLSADMNRLIHDRKNHFSIGTEYMMLQAFTLRGGYLLSHAQPKTASSLSGLGGGFGLKIANSSMDYAFTPFGELGNTHRVSFSMKF